MKKQKFYIAACILAVFCFVFTYTACKSTNKKNELPSYSGPKWPKDFIPLDGDGKEFKYGNFLNGKTAVAFRSEIYREFFNSWDNPDLIVYTNYPDSGFTFFSIVSVSGKTITVKDLDDQEYILCTDYTITGSGAGKATLVLSGGDIQVGIYGIDLVLAK